MKKRNFLALACLILMNSCSPVAAPASTTKTSTAVNPGPAKEYPEMSLPGEDIIMATSLALQIAMNDKEETDIAGLTEAFNRAIKSHISFSVVLEESHLNRQEVVEAFEKLSTLYPDSQELARYLAMFRSLRDSEKARLF